MPPARAWQRGFHPSMPVAGHKDEAWLANKAQEDGVVKRRSGLMYKILTGLADGSSRVSPKLRTPCLCHYEVFPMLDLCRINQPNVTCDNADGYANH
jgi:hypothetical protein